MRFILILIMSCACAFGATTITDGIVSSYYTETNGIYTYIYEVASTSFEKQSAWKQAKTALVAIKPQQPKTDQ